MIGETCQTEREKSEDKQNGVVGDLDREVIKSW